MMKIIPHMQDRLISGTENQKIILIVQFVNFIEDYIGSLVVREQMEIFIGAARGRGEALDHTLIFGPPGLGKTTLANIIAREMGGNLKSTSGPVLNVQAIWRQCSPILKRAMFFLLMKSTAFLQ